MDLLEPTPPPIVRIELGRDGNAFIRFTVANVPDPDVRRQLKSLCSKYSYKWDGVNAHRGPAWNLAKFINLIRERGVQPHLGASVASEMGRLAATLANPDGDARADARMAAMEAATGNKFRDYQRADVRWMERVGNCILGNHMRTGKTVTVLAMIPEAGALIVCPLSVKGVWVDHIKRWLPWVSVNTRAAAWESGANKVTIINYEALPSGDKLAQVNIPPGMLLVADEAHKLKNAVSIRHRKFKAIADRVRSTGGHVILATGTPAPNRPGQELWPLMELIGVGTRLFGDARSFAKEATLSIGEDGVAGRLSEIITVRTLASVAGSLPPYTWQDVEITWDDLEGSSSVKAALDTLWEKYKGEKDILAAIRRHPTDVGEYSRCRAALAALKTPLAFEWALGMQEEREPAVVVSAHREPILRLARLDRWACIVGGMPESERQANIDALNAGKLDGLAITIGAGSVGLDLSRADNLLSIDRSWVPGDNEQAAARIVSIANPRPKFGTRFLLDHPIEQRVEQVLSAKMIAIGNTVGAVGTNGGIGSANAFSILTEAHQAAAPHDVDIMELNAMLGSLEL